MRISYTDLFDLFLAQTTSDWPIAVVFSHQSQDINKERSSTFTLDGDCIEASNFLRQLNSESRHSACGKMHELVQKDIETFMPIPKKIQVEMSSDIFSACLHHQSAGEIFSNDVPDLSPLFCHNLEDTIGILFVRYTKADFGASVSGGHGIVVSKLSQGWSSPCAIAVFGLGTGFSFGCTQNDFLICIHDKELMRKFHDGAQFTFGTNASLSGCGRGVEYCGLTLSSLVENKGERFYTAYARQNYGALCGVSIESISIVSMSFINTSTYGAGITSDDILSGRINAPRSRSSDALHAAIRCCISPYNFYSHPIVPDSLKNYSRTLWSIDYSSVLSTRRPSAFLHKRNPLVDPSLTLREFLLCVSNNSSIMSRTSRHEIDLFRAKFRRFLLEGIPIMYLLKSNNCFEKRFLYLIHNVNGAYPLLCFLRTDIKKNMARLNIAENKDFHDDCIIINRIVKLSQDVPKSCVVLKDKIKSRFLSLESDTGRTKMFLTNTENDAEVLLIGFKLIFEYELQN